MAEDHELGCGSGTSRKEVGNHRILQSNLALVLETVSVALHKVKEGHGSIWTTFKSCIKVISWFRNVLFLLQLLFLFLAFF